MFTSKHVRVVGLWLFLMVFFHVPATFGAYGDYSSSLPAWLDQNETSADGHYTIHYTDDVHHSAPYVGDPDTDGDGLPDPWETDFIGNTASGQNADSDADGHDNLAEFNAGSWPNEDFFRPIDTISPAENGAGQNLIARDVIDVLTFCEGRYDAWGFNAPWGLPLGVQIRYTQFAGWGNVNPLWCSSDVVGNLADPNRRWVAIHELFHNVQRAYPDTPGDTKWFVEGSARMSQDYFYDDMDRDANSNYAGQVRGFLGDHNSSGLFERSYSAVFFWKYLCEQTGGAITGQPSEGFDAMDRYMRSSRGLEADESLQRYLDDLDPDHFWHRKRADHFFAAWSTALYTRQFDPASMSPLYYYADEQENLPSSLERSVEIDNCAYVEAANSYTPETVPLNGNVLYNDINPDTWTRHLDAWRSRYYAFEPDAGARIVLVWVDGESGQRNYYATVTSRGGNVTDIAFNYGEDHMKAYFNNAMDELGVVVTALDAAADYDLMVWTLSDYWINIVYPTETNKESVRIPQPDDLSTFEVHLRVWTEKSENPDDDIFIDGLSPDLFEVQVDGEPAEVLSGHQMLNEYWLTCAAPELPPGEYDLAVRLLDRSDMEPRSLEYLERPHVDRMIVIDRSGSMGSEIMGNNEKMLAAKSGGRLYTDLLVEKDMLGLVSFGGDADDDPANATLHEGLADVSDAYKLTVKDAIDNDLTDDPSQYEHTAMGQGILAGYDQLVARGRADDDWRIALLTDGLEDRSPYWADAAVSGVVTPSDVKIDAIALGAGAHEFLLSSIADDTEGEYFYVAVPTISGGRSTSRAPASTVDPIVENHIADVFRQINERDIDHTRIWSVEGTAGTTARTEQFTVYEGMGDLILTVNWPQKSPIAYKLYTPGGDSMGPTYTAETHAVYHLPAAPGEWRLEVGATSSTPYLAILSGRGSIKSKLFFTQPDGSDKIGSVQKILFSLIKKGGPVADAVVWATIFSPDGGVKKMQLFDTGDHGDWASGDMIFSRDFRRTPEYGSYRVRVVAEGNDGKYDFRIEDNGVFVITGDYDRDKDGMPDEWERRYGLQSSENDAEGDRDNDFLKNIDEFKTGGHPGNADTDNGGTLDGSEYKYGMDVADFSDDRIGPPPALMTNQQPTDAVDPDYQAPPPRANLLYWSRGSNYDTIDIYRSTASSGPFTLIESDWPAEKRPYPDEGLINNQTYYYKVAAKTAEGIMSRLSKPVMGIPKEDNLAPVGGIQIAGPSHTADLLVDLELDASGDTVRMRFSNRSDFKGSTWEPFAKQRKDWKIGGYPGANFVYVQFSDAFDNVSLAFYDAITYHADTDGDKLGDIWEIAYFGNLDQLATDDWPDGDDLNNLGEYRNGANPLREDTDGDGLLDGWEVKMGTNPVLNDAEADPDKDGFTNIMEYKANTDPFDTENHPDIVMGDVNGDGQLGLDDVILGLLVAVGSSPTGASIHADVDGNGQIGLAEVVYVIQALAVR